MCKYDSNKLEHNQTVKLPQALSVVQLFNTPLLTLLDRCSGFYTLPSQNQAKSQETTGFWLSGILWRVWGRNG